MPDTKRRLTVFKPSDDDDDEARPPWQWVGFGTAAMFGIWLPLAYLGEAVKARALADRLGDAKTPDEIAARFRALETWQIRRLELLVFGAMLVPLALAAFGGGFLVGRWGKGAGAREAALAAVMTMLIAGALTCAQTPSGAAFEALVPLVITAPLAAWGGRIGTRRRARLHGPDA